MVRKKEPSFSLNDFRKWMDHQHEHQQQLGMKVESKISLRKLLEKIEPQEGELYDLAKEFKRGGGIIVETDGNSFLVEVKSGNFLISRLFVRQPEF